MRKETIGGCTGFAACCKGEITKSLVKIKLGDGGGEDYVCFCQCYLQACYRKACGRTPIFVLYLYTFYLIDIMWGTCVFTYVCIEGPTYEYQNIVQIISDNSLGILSA